MKAHEAACRTKRRTVEKSNDYEMRSSKRKNDQISKDDSNAFPVGPAVSSIPATSEPAGPSNQPPQAAINIPSIGHHRVDAPRQVSNGDNPIRQGTAPQVPSDPDAVPPSYDVPDGVRDLFPHSQAFIKAASNPNGLLGSVKLTEMAENVDQLCLSQKKQEILLRYLSKTMNEEWIPKSSKSFSKKLNQCIPTSSRVCAQLICSTPWPIHRSLDLLVRFTAASERSG